jgi:hypothetical protein
MKRTGRDEPIGIVIQICMERTQGNSLCSYLYLKLAKILYFCFYLLCFFSSTKSEKLFCVGRGLAPVGGVRWHGKR